MKHPVYLHWKDKIKKKHIIEQWEVPFYYANIYPYESNFIFEHTKCVDVEICYIMCAWRCNSRAHRQSYILYFGIDITLFIYLLHNKGESDEWKKNIKKTIIENGMKIKYKYFISWYKKWKYLWLSFFFVNDKYAFFNMFVPIDIF